MIFSLSPRGSRIARGGPDGSPLTSSSTSPSKGSTVSFAESEQTQGQNKRRARSASFEKATGRDGASKWREDEGSYTTGASDDDDDIRTISEADTESEHEEEDSHGSRISASRTRSVPPFQWCLSLLTVIATTQNRKTRKSLRQRRAVAACGPGWRPPRPVLVPQVYMAG